MQETSNAEVLERRVYLRKIGGGGTYAAIGARIWLPAKDVGMIIDRGNDFPLSIQQKLDTYGSEMWLFRDQVDRVTTRGLNTYQGEHRNFEYITPRLRIMPYDLRNTRLDRCTVLHFICSPSRAASILKSVKDVDGWQPITIFEPIPDCCVPDELPALLEVLPLISILSPNAEEALSLLSLPSNPTKSMVEQAAEKILNFGVGPAEGGFVIVRSGGMGAYVVSRRRHGEWIDALWNDKDNAHKIVDVTGAGNSFLGGLGAGLLLTKGDVHQATLYATVSASFTIEQEGLPKLSTIPTSDGVVEAWNDELPERRLEELRARHDSNKK